MIRAELEISPLACEINARITVVDLQPPDISERESYKAAARSWRSDRIDIKTSVSLYYETSLSDAQDCLNKFAHNT
jgi:hypothetical protein